MLGSSPHVRGALLVVEPLRVRGGIIPACAGSTRDCDGTPYIRWDHPRMCGEHRVRLICRVLRTGSSPHVRGAPAAVVVCHLVRGIIPACAGSTNRRGWCAWPKRDHPRMCGEHDAHTAIRRSDRGSSPHVRGALFSSLVSFRIWGIIPACAGSTFVARRTADRVRDHPRMCGEHSENVPRSFASTGSSPHVRGARSLICCCFSMGIIPACAGSTHRECHPHLRPQGSSPHVRGAPLSRLEAPRAAGIIPACAGSTRAGMTMYDSAWDHPRMCGEHTV